MINITPKAQPVTFEKTVRNPGTAFLKITPKPTSKEFKPHRYWKHAAKDLHAAYRGICAYSCMLILPPGTVDHFLPTSTHPQLAYEWANFRLSSYRLNNHKGRSTEVIDPFVVQPGWFTLDVPSCLIKPGPEVSDAISDQVNKTIGILKLNEDDVLVQERCDILMLYVAGEVSIGFLEKRYPFMALELQRQGIQDMIRTMLKTPTAS